MRAKRVLMQGASWYEVRTAVNNREPLFCRQEAVKVFCQVFGEAHGRFAFELRGLRLEEERLSFYIRPTDGFPGTTGATLSTAGPGTVTVTATVANGTALGTPYTKDFDITIGNYIKVSGVSLNMTSLPLAVDHTEALSVVPRQN
jgi:hypothetical protein